MMITRNDGRFCFDHQSYNPFLLFSSTQVSISRFFRLLTSQVLITTQSIRPTAMAVWPDSPCASDYQTNFPLQHVCMSDDGAKEVSVGSNI